jgi:diguanylate cyclase (GGDEF)-like protein
MPNFRSFQGRLLFFFLGLFVLVYMLAFLSVNTVVTQNAHGQVKNELLAGGRIFDRLMKVRTERLMLAARTLSGDFGFKVAFGDGDKPTLLSAMHNHAGRIQAGVMQLVSLDSVLIADTLHPDAAPEKFQFSGLIETAEQSGEASAIVSIEDRLYQVVIVPLLAPVPVAWICMGFIIDDSLARELQTLNTLDVTLVRERPKETPVIFGSTLSEGLRGAFSEAVHSATWDSEGSTVADMGGVKYACLFLELDRQDDSSVKVFLQRSMDKALLPLYRLQKILAALFIIGLCITLIGGVLVSGTVTKPVRMLAESARSIEQGDYTRAVPIGRQDELGRLSSAFNTMVGAIAQREEQIKFQAYHDTLTGLPNRSFLHMRLEKAVAAARSGNGPFALIAMDISRLRDVNAALGEATGDVVLQKVGSLLNRPIPDSAAVARIGGDEFAVLLQAKDGVDGAVVYVQKIVKLLETPVSVSETPIQIEASFGIAVHPAHGADADALLRHAETAMHLAKTSTRGYSVYAPESDHLGLRHLTLLGELRHAIEQEEMVLYYQPKVSLDTGRITGMEALIRWKHPRLGFMQPDEFMPLLEQTGLIRPLTYWSLKTAIEQCARLNESRLNLRMAINISARMIPDLQLPEQVTSFLNKYRVPPEQITLEVIESAIMAYPERTLDNITRLDSTGVLLSVDDFGTGYSSLSHLQKLPVDELKIDKSFVHDMDTNANDATIVRSMIELAHNLGLEVTAEGVETQKIWDILKSRGCDLAQGYFMAEPMPADELLRWVKESKWGLG